MWTLIHPRPTAVPINGNGYELHSLGRTGCTGWQYSEKPSIIETMRLRWLQKLVKDTAAQDLIEYALMAGFVAVAAGAVMPSVASSISTVFSQISSVLAAASSQS
jgi:Flp pilus assembly pilin Flp